MASEPRNQHVSTLMVTTPREARRAVTDALLNQCAHAVEIAQLLVSEMVTNAMLHADAKEVRIEVGVGDGRATLAVCDESTTMPVVQHLVPDSIGGRGMLLIERLAHSWGVSPAENGKKVWIELPCDGHGGDSAASSEV